MLAVPMTPQVPASRPIQRRDGRGKAGLLTVGANSSFSSPISSISMAPARYLAQLLRQSVQAPMRVPRWLPGIMGPVKRWMAGLFADMAPMV